MCNLFPIASPDNRKTYARGMCIIQPHDSPRARARSIKPTLRKVPKFNVKIERMLLNARKEVGFTVNLKSVKKSEHLKSEQESQQQAPEWSLRKQQSEQQQQQPQQQPSQ